MRLRPEISRASLDLLSVQRAAMTLEAEMNEKILRNQTCMNPQECPLQTGSTSLIEAVQAQVVVKFLEIMNRMKKTPVNRTDDTGSTVLHYAASLGLGPVCFAVLLHPHFTSASATNISDAGSGSTAVELAVQHGHIGLARALDAFISGMDTCEHGGNSGAASDDDSGDSDGFTVGVSSSAKGNGKTAWPHHSVSSKGFGKGKSKDDYDDSDGWSVRSVICYGYHDSDGSAVGGSSSATWPYHPVSSKGFGKGKGKDDYHDDSDCCSVGVISHDDSDGAVGGSSFAKGQGKTARPHHSVSSKGFGKGKWQ